MIVVKAELWPGGDESRAKQIGEMRIINEADLRPISDYSFTVNQHAWPEQNVPARIITGDIFDHLRKAPIWTLVQKVLNRAYK